MPSVEYSPVVPLDVLTEERCQEVLEACTKVIEIPEDFVFSVAVVSNEEIAPINEQYREKQGPTDVLSFPYDETSGEIVISADKVRSQAKEYGNTEEAEAVFLLVHGILHIMGWDHERSEEEAAAQRALEEEITQLCGVVCAR